MRLALAAVALMVAASISALADDAPAFKAHELSPEREAAWVKAVQDTKTDDGTTVLQALRYAEKLQSGRFKFGKFEAGYNGASGEPESIAIPFWIGAKLEDDDAFSILFDVTDAGSKVSVARPKTQYGGTAAEAVVSDRGGLLHFIDEQYRENCIDPNGGAKLC